MTVPTISVIVPVWNDEKRIGQCIDALQRQTLRADLFEIIVVDNGSTDSTASVVARHPNIILLREPQPGSYAARNRGLAHARGEYVAFTDADCIPQRDWLEQGLNAVVGRTNIGVVAGRVAFCEPTGKYNRACLNYDRHISLRQEDYARAGRAITANWFSRKSILLEKGGFDTRMKSGADHELSRRVSKSGLQTLYLSKATVMHPPRTQVVEITGRARRLVGGRWSATTGRLRLLRRIKTETQKLVARSWIIARANNLTLQERVEVWGLLLRVWAVSLSELLRLQFGGMPARS
jgi:glycosyltransferase involved in cell wall biosynthesis